MKKEYLMTGSRYSVIAFACFALLGVVFPHDLMSLGFIASLIAVVVFLGLIFLHKLTKKN